MTQSTSSRVNEAMLPEDVFANIIKILNDGECHLNGDPGPLCMFDNVDSFIGGEVDEEPASASCERSPISAKDLTTSELERLVKASEHRLQENLSFLNHKPGQKKTSAVSSGKGSEKMIVRISPTPVNINPIPAKPAEPMEVEEK